MKHRLATVCAPLVAAVVLMLSPWSYGRPSPGADASAWGLWRLLDAPLPFLLSLLALTPAIAAAFDRPRAHESDQLQETQRVRRSLPALAAAWVLSFALAIGVSLVDEAGVWIALSWALPWSVLFAVVVGADPYLRAVVAVVAACAFAVVVDPVQQWSGHSRAVLVLAMAGALALLRMFVGDRPAPARTAEMKAAHMPGPLVAAALVVELANELCRAADPHWLAGVGGVGVCDGVDTAFVLGLALSLAGAFLVAIVASFARAPLVWAGACLPWLWMQIGYYQLHFDTAVEMGDTWCFAAPSVELRTLLARFGSLLFDYGGAQWAVAGTSLPLVALAVLRWRARAYTPLAVTALLLLMGRSAALALLTQSARSEALELVLFAAALVALAIPGRARA